MITGKKRSFIVLWVVGLFLITSCMVSKSKYQSTKNNLKETEEKYDSLRTANIILKRKTADYKQVKEENQRKEKQIDTLQTEVTSLKQEYEDMAKQVKRLKMLTHYLRHKNDVIKNRYSRISHIVNSKIDTPRMDSVDQSAIAR